MSGQDQRDGQTPYVKADNGSTIHGGVNITNGPATIIGGNQIINNIPAGGQPPPYIDTENVMANRRNLPPVQGERKAPNDQRPFQREPSQSDDRSNPQTQYDIEMKDLVNMVAQRYQEPPDFLYNMGNNGRVVIINNVHFDHFKERIGSDQDVKLLQDFFLYTIRWNDNLEIYRDLTVAKMKDKLTNLSRYDFTRNGAFFLIILSHGNEYGICGRDSRQKDHRNVLKIEEDVLPLFTSTKCPSLVEKPKVFIMQACRGDVDDLGYCIEDTDADCAAPPTNFKRHVPDTSEFLLCYPCSPGYTSVRNQAFGSVFINSLVQIFKEQYKREDILRMLLRVNHKIAKDTNSLRIKQMPCHDNRLTRLTFFEDFFLEKKKLLIESGALSS
ncbi:caspase-3-like isoform X1 [Clytia hemisphaerica]|uniref:Uncharacterized protein n=1 Tax=Clytia hemisphaerica TaxID=252671 RepID=A0A7M5X1Q2_9CNID|eukprot:TCONS_00058430-protein